MDDITNEDRVDTALILYDAFLKANYDNVRAASEIFYELKEQRTAYTELEADYQALKARHEIVTGRLQEFGMGILSVEIPSDDRQPT